MTDDVAKLPPFAHRETTRHGKPVYYFRKGHAPRIRLPTFGTPAFDIAYQQALIGMLPPAKKRLGRAGTLEWLIERYRETTAYRALSIATRKHRNAIFRGIIEKSGDVQFSAVTQRKIVEGRELRAATPHQARHFLDTMRGLFAWAIEAEHVRADPTLGVKNPPKPRNAPGFKPWPEEDVAAYRARWPLGTRQRVWLDVLYYTGLRRGDAVRVGRQHVRDNVITLKTEKTGTEVYVPILPELAVSLAAGPIGDLAFIVGAKGEPLVKETFGNVFREACNAAGVEKSAHGLRKSSATVAAEAGVTVAELEARYGWTGGKMASHYTRSADRRRLAMQAGEKIANADLPHLGSQVPHLNKSVDRSKA